jgi:zinc protease
MKRMSGGLRASVAMLVALAACSSPRSNVRIGSLTPSPRSVDYDPGIVSWKLANQLTVAMMPDKRVNLVTVEVRYLVGAAEDPPGKTGLAHLVEHVMFARRAGPGPDIYHRLAAAALSYNASTTWDSTHYITIGLASRLDDLLAIEAARMASGCDGVDEAAVAHERAIVLEEIAQRDAADVRGPLHQMVFGPDHAYGHSVGGHDVAALTRDDVCSFIEAHYAPSRAILVVSGSIPGAAVHSITARFGAIARRATGARTAVRPVAWTGQVSDLPAAVDDPGVMVVFPAAPWGSTESIYDNLIDRIVLRRLQQAARRESWILDVSLEQLGGEHGGARGFAFRLTDAGRADDAVAKVFVAARDLPGRFDDDLILALASARQNELLDAFASIDSRGWWCADFLQFTTHGRFQMRELAELQHLDPIVLRERGGLLGRDASRVVKIVPSHTRTRTGDAVFTASASSDLPVWRAPVDPAEASRPIALPRDVRTSALTERRLANGLRVVMLPDAKQPIFDARLVFPVGGAETAGGKSGVAIAAAGMLWHDLQGWFTPTERRIVDWVLRLGAPVEWTVTDHTAFRVHGFSLFADAHLWRLHWLLANGRYERVDVDRWQELIARDAAHLDRSRAGRRALHEALFGRGHPYAQDWLTALASNAGSLGPVDLERFRDTYYRASGATLILVGNFDPEAMMKLVTELFGAWPSGSPPAVAPIPPARPAAGPTWIADVDSEAVQVGVRLGVRCDLTADGAERSPRGRRDGAQSRRQDPLPAERELWHPGEVRYRRGGRPSRGPWPGGRRPRRRGRAPDRGGSRRAAHGRCRVRRGLRAGAPRRAGPGARRSGAVQHHRRPAGGSGRQSASARCGRDLGGRDRVDHDRRRTGGDRAGSPACADGDDAQRAAAGHRSGARSSRRDPVRDSARAAGRALSARRSSIALRDVDDPEPLAQRRRDRGVAQRLVHLAPP